MRDIEYFWGYVVMFFLVLSGKMEPSLSMHFSRLSVASPGSQLGGSQLGPRILIFLFNYLLSLYPGIFVPSLGFMERERNKKNKLLA